MHYLLTFIGVVLLSGAAFGQSRGTLVKQGAKGLSAGAESALASQVGRQVAANTARTAVTSGAVQAATKAASSQVQSSGTAVRASSMAARPDFSTRQLPARMPGQSALQRSRFPEIDLLRQQGASLQREADLLNTVGFGGGFGRSVLLAPVEAEGKTGGFSVTAIEVNGEVFGVVASHVLPESYYTLRSSLQRKFHVQVTQADGTQQLLAAEVVQISPRSMLDMSLVKFSPQAEQFVIPLPLASTSAEVNEELLSPGFAATVPQIEKRTVQRNSFLSVRTDQNLKGDRQGFCGSPLLDINGQVKAIHTGTKVSKDGSEVSYGGHVRFINLLVEAYHTNGQAAYDLEIGGHAIARLNVDEYISAVYFYDANGKRILQKNLEEKFSESFVQQALRDHPHTAYIQLTSRKAQWETDADGDSILKEDRSRSDKTKRQHFYDVKNKQMLPTRPDVIKM